MITSCITDLKSVVIWLYYDVVDIIYVSKYRFQNLKNLMYSHNRTPKLREITANQNTWYDLVY